MNNESTHNVVLNEKTTFGLTFGQVFAFIVAIFTFTMAYASINTRLTALEEWQGRYEVIHEKQDAYNSTLTKSIEAIEKSLIRIEGKLDTKQDKKWQ